MELESSFPNSRGGHVAAINIEQLGEQLSTKETERKEKDQALRKKSIIQEQRASDQAQCTASHEMQYMYTFQDFEQQTAIAIEPLRKQPTVAEYVSWYITLVRFTTLPQITLHINGCMCLHTYINLELNCL